MQRLHCWLDQLTLRRSRNREAGGGGSRRNGGVSQSVAPSCRLNMETKSKHELRAVNAPMISSARAAAAAAAAAPPPAMARKLETGSFARRRGIRTNPWLYGENSLRNSSPFRAEPPPLAQSLDRRCVPPTTLLGVKSLEESTCSSGYGSQDCSPDSSVHLPSWQTASSPFADEPIDDGCFLEETSSFSTYDNVCNEDEHIYHELELCCRAPERSYSSEQLSSLEDSRSSSPLYARPDSPIYAQPWTHYQFAPAHRIPNVIFAERNPNAKPLTVRNQSFRRMLPEIRHSDYATPYAVSASMTYLERTNSLVYPGSYFSRVTSTHLYEEPTKESDPVDEAEEEFLTELDAQIAELQLRSDELRSIVEKARLRRNINWLRPPMECTFELSI
ncbi:hypothetical protein Y032_0193g1388 [Ancylostoma ceylanicum]|uniref:Uncharacterized protein n=1 Tax=Ancylostoma ceylanicum TaxID=53326 RepID=A0A016SQ82_9BILA|nr:hypothetical protein Y032_0193g1388 [Ancylostoma ceylanicum]